MITMAQRIEALRTEKGLSRPALSAALGLPKSAAEKFETGRQTPTQDQQQKLASFFGVSLFYLRGESDDRTQMENWLNSSFTDEPQPQAPVRPQAPARQVAASAGGAIFGFLLPTLTSALMTPFFPRSLGGGDFKMLTALGSWLGFLDLFVVICFSVIYFAVFAVIRKKKTGPYGFSLFISVITVLVLRHFGLTDYLIPFL